MAALESRDGRHVVTPSVAFDDDVEISGHRAILVPCGSTVTPEKRPEPVTRPFPWHVSCGLFRLRAGAVPAAVESSRRPPPLSIQPDPKEASTCERKSS